MKINFYKSGIEDKRFSDLFNRYKMLKKILPKKIICFDVGANEGQTILEISKNFPGSIIHSFEPQKSCETKLEYFKNKIKKSKIYINIVACGEKNINKIFYAHDSSNLSSFLKINTKSKFLLKMKQLSKKKKYLESINNPIKVRQITLSDYIKNKKVRTIDLLKIDTQGYELNVLKGIKKQDLFKIKIILLEVNFWDYYEKMTSFYEIEKILGRNFKFWDISFIYKNPKYLSTDYVDAVYINKFFYDKLKKNLK